MSGCTAAARDSTRCHVDTAVVYRVSRGGGLLGFAQVRNVKGKEQPITYLVATDSADALRDVDILVYREAYGGEVAYEPWRKQFRGKTAAAPLQVGKDIQNISGATISSNAVTRGVRQALADLTAWHARGSSSDAGRERHPGGRRRPLLRALGFWVD